MRPALLVFLAWLACSCAALGTSDVSFYTASFALPSLASDRFDSVQEIVRPACQGVAISPTDVVTAAHCVKYAVPAGFAVISTNEQTDVARLRSLFPQLVFSPIARSVPATGHTRRGPVELHADGTFAGAVARGDSGSGIFDEAGGLVGVVTGCRGPAGGECAEGSIGYWGRP